MLLRREGEEEEEKGACKGMPIYPFEYGLGGWSEGKEREDSLEVNYGLGPRVKVAVWIPVLRSMATLMRLSVDRYTCLSPSRSECK